MNTTPSAGKSTIKETAGSFETGCRTRKTDVITTPEVADKPHPAAATK
jgi:hypothetical protein